MGSLSNLYISQSFISLLHLGSNNTASATLTELEDGLGNGIGVSVNTAGDVALGGTLSIKKGLDITGSVKINTAVTASTPSYVNSGNYYTDYIIRITGSFASGSAASPTVNEVQVGWPVYGDGLVSGALVTNKNYINANFVELTINQNTAQWFGEYYFTNPATQYYNFAVSGSEDITGSLWVRDNITTTNISASGEISASNLWVKGRISAYELNVTIESASIIFTSGSNIIGDNANEDTQTLIGRTIVTGSLEVTSSIKATTDISSSTLNGIGNVTLYSQSVDNRLDYLEGTFSTSVDSRLDLVEATASYLNTTFSTSVDSRLDLVESTASYLNTTFSTSVDSRFDSLESWSSSLLLTFATDAELNYSSSVLQSNINTKLDTASFNSYSASVASNTSILSASIYQTDATQSNNFTTNSSSVATRLNTIEVRYATTGSNTFVGNQTITGSVTISGSFTEIGNMVYSGSVRGIVLPLTISSQTASMDLSRGNFFTLTLVSGSNTHISCSNINPGETISLRITQSPASFGTVSFAPTIKISQFSPYIATPISSSVDVISFLSFDTSAIYGAAVNNLR